LATNWSNLRQHLRLWVPGAVPFWPRARPHRGINKRANNNSHNIITGLSPFEGGTPCDSYASHIADRRVMIHGPTEKAVGQAPGCPPPPPLGWAQLPALLDSILPWIDLICRAENEFEFQSSRVELSRFDTRRGNNVSYWASIKEICVPLRSPLIALMWAQKCVRGCGKRRGVGQEVELCGGALAAQKPSSKLKKCWCCKHQRQSHGAAGSPGSNCPSRSVCGHTLAKKKGSQVGIFDFLNLKTIQTNFQHCELRTMSFNWFIKLSNVYL